MLENVRMALMGIWAHKMRSFLTMLGVIIGIASIIAIVSTIEGTNQQIMESLLGSGNNNINVKLYQDGMEVYFYGDNITGIAQPDDSIKEQIRNIEGVEDASFYFTMMYMTTLSYKDTSTEIGSFYGVDSHYINTGKYNIIKGRDFTEEDFENRSKVVLIDTATAETLFADEEPVGCIIDINGEPFTVIGVIKESSSVNSAIHTFEDYMTYKSDQYGTAMIPYTLWPLLYNFDDPMNLLLRTEDAQQMTEAGKQAADIMSGLISSDKTDYSYTADDLLEKVRSQQELSSGTNNLLLWVAGISLLVGGIGVMNIMLVSVTERTNEIGLKKAVGAKKRTILLQFLTESAVLTLIGGILGIIFGLILAQVISNMSGTPVAISIPAIIVAVAFSMAIGIGFGLLPSLKAASMNPIEALRRE